MVLIKITYIKSKATYIELKMYVGVHESQLCTWELLVKTHTQRSILGMSDHEGVLKLQDK